MRFATFRLRTTWLWDRFPQIKAKDGVKNRISHILYATAHHECTQTLTVQRCSCVAWKDTSTHYTPSIYMSVPLHLSCPHARLLLLLLLLLMMIIVIIILLIIMYMLIMMLLSILILIAIPTIERLAEH